MSYRLRSFGLGGQGVDIATAGSSRASAGKWLMTDTRISLPRSH